MGASMEGRVGPCPSHPRKNKHFFLYGGPFSLCGDLFANFCYLFFMCMGGLFGLAAPLSTKCLQWCSGKFSFVERYHGIIATYPIIIELGGGGGGCLHE